MKQILSFLVLIFLHSGLQAQKPIIGLSTNYDSSLSVPNTYVLSVLRAGGIPLLIPANTDASAVAAMVAAVDAVILTGGEDLDPLEQYNQEPLPALGEVVPLRDRFDRMLILEAARQGKPILGICRGEQALNVVFGGTLYQDIPSQVKGSIKHLQRAPREQGTHSIRIEPGSNLAKALGKTSAKVNSYHHQAVRDLAPGFKVTARAPDGVIEAIEKIDNPHIWGVQFHPEGPTSMGSDEFLPIFENLVKAAAELR